MTPEQIATLQPMDRPIARLIARRGLVATFNGNAWRVIGPGVDILVARLRYIPEEHLRPFLPHKNWHW